MMKKVKGSAESLKWNKAGKKEGYSRGFEFRLLEVKSLNDDGEFNAYAKYEVKIGNVSDEYHTQYLYPTAEPENGTHQNVFNKYHSLENEIMTCINEHLWNVVDTDCYEIEDGFPLDDSKDVYGIFTTGMIGEPQAFGSFQFCIDYLKENLVEEENYNTGYSIIKTKGWNL